MRHVLFFLTILAAASACRKSDPTPPPPSAPDAATDPAPTPPTGESKVSGTVTYAGSASSGTIRMASDPFCARHQQNDETVLVDGQGHLANAVVWVKGLPSEGTAEGRMELRQDGCLYRPRVSAVRTGVTVAISNADGTLHNIHTYRPSGATLFNVAQVPGMPPILTRFGDSGLISFKCDVHPWMSAYVHVFDHPHYAVTGRDGTFDLGKIPAGRQTIVVWHEKLDQQEVTMDFRPNELSIVLLELLEHR